MAPDISNFLRLGRQNRTGAGLQQRLEYLWRSCSGSVNQQSDLFRLTYVIEHLKTKGWLNAVVTDDEWKPVELQAEYADVPALLVRKSELMRNFSGQGQQFARADLNLAGNGLIPGNIPGVRGLYYAIRE